MSRRSLSLTMSPRDDEYRGYRIPANSLVIGNAWFVVQSWTISISHQLAFFFHITGRFCMTKPERFLLSDGKLNPTTRDPETVAFGFGRRICPGRHMAAASLWIVVASILSTFNIDKAIGENGEIIEPTRVFSGNSIVGHPSRSNVQSPRGPHRQWTRFRPLLSE
ncbi:Cytochrome P450 [Mycena sanguinolenta]|uniref:Cytochrome P450 n=1 Tax=Mycena sanguinolenta TaxID=230812 RepID=A0A8H6X4D4_9AGAR|nr:Cytochrome P450 [Mycena sanguinolenta]